MTWVVICGILNLSKAWIIGSLELSYDYNYMNLLRYVGMHRNTLYRRNTLIRV